MWILKRTNQGGGYVARAGSTSSYTTLIECARKYKSEAEAKADACGNEIAIDVDSILRSST